MPARPPSFVWGLVRPEAAAEASLRAVMYRLRQTIDREEPALANCIRTGRGSYRWNPALTCSIDVQELQRASAEAVAAAPPRQDELEQAVIALYKGRLLPEAAGKLWVDRRQVELHALYKTALYHQIERARARGDLSAAESLSRRGLQMDAADERLYIEQILCLQALERPQEAAAAAGRARALGFLHTGIPGLSDLDSSHQRLIRAQAAMQREAAHIEEEIRLGGAGSGTFICSYAAFRCISQVRLRASTRYHHPLLVLDDFVDDHLIEIFVDGGRYVVSHVVYGLKDRLEGPVEQLLTLREDG